MSDRRAYEGTLLGEKLSQRFREKGINPDLIELDDVLDRALRTQRQPVLAINQVKQVLRTKEYLLNLAIERLLLQRSEEWQQKAGLTGHLSSADEGHPAHARNPAHECDDEGQTDRASNGHEGDVSSSHLNDGDGGHSSHASDGHSTRAASSSTNGDGMGHEGIAGNGQSGSAHPSPPIRGVGATIDVPKGHHSAAPTAANPNREPSVAALRAVHNAEMRRAKYILRLPDGKDLTEIYGSEVAHYETTTARHAVVNYVMRVIRRDYPSIDPSKLLGSEGSNALPLASLQRIVKEAEESVYGQVA
jgi:hypothetical protein